MIREDLEITLDEIIAFFGSIEEYEEMYGKITEEE